jgi:hypothetical protein
MEVCDLSGDKVGTVAHIYRYPEAAGASGEGSPAASTEPPPYGGVTSSSHQSSPASRDCHPGCKPVKRMLAPTAGARG